ncbi:hypothetical protein TNCV_1622391 [Trichonephila clavipes]|nr:hypothetical protein TNCV_1622391 [Trichonephila clavipes]
MSSICGRVLSLGKKVSWGNSNNTSNAAELFRGACESFFRRKYIKAESCEKDHIESRSVFSVAVLKVNSHVAERNMVSTQIFLIFLSLSILVIAHGWQQSDSVYNDDSLAMMPGNGWKENPEKRNTWWTKKSVRDEDVPNGENTFIIFIYIKGVF